MLGTNVSPFAEYGWVWQPSLQSLIVLGELLLGVWLLLPHGRFFSWLAATITFGVFATVSGYLGFLGQASCGCFGAIKTSPWWVIGLDIGILLALLQARLASTVNVGTTQRTTVQKGKSYGVRRKLKALGDRLLQLSTNTSVTAFAFL